MVVLVASALVILGVPVTVTGAVVAPRVRATCVLLTGILGATAAPDATSVATATTATPSWAFIATVAGF